MAKPCIVALVVALSVTTEAEPTRAWGTVDSFGLLRWERFSANPAVGTLVALLARPAVGPADLRAADAAVARKPDDLPSRALRAELRLRVDPAAPRTMPHDTASLFRMRKPDRFEASYLYYHYRRTEHPERLGITTGRDKGVPPYKNFGEDDLETLQISDALGDTSWSERMLELDDWLRYGAIQDSRKLARRLGAERPDVWEFKAFQAFALRYGGRYVDPNAKVDPEFVRRPGDALVLAQGMIRLHPECRVLVQLAGVCARDLKKYELAGAYLRAYLADPDPGVQGERRSRDVRELLSTLPKQGN